MKPRKSKAWLIVLIVVIILLVILVYLFSNKEQIFGTKGAENITKTFSPLLGSSKKKDVVTPDGTSSGSTSVNNNTSGSGTDTETNTPSSGFGSGDGFTTGNGLATGEGFGSGDGFGSDGGFGSGGSGYTPPLVPLPTPSTGGSVPPITTTTTTTQTTTTTATPPPDPNFCPDVALEFTDAEKEELAGLLRQYYLIAPTIKDADDLALVNADIATNEALLAQVGTLTNQCNAEKTNVNYTGPRAIKDNPYYNDPATSTNTPYLPSFSQLEEIFDIW